MTAVKVSPVKNEAGFSLIDMLFVVALIGLLATLAIPGLMRARGAAQSVSALGTLRVVSSAQLSFAITCGLGFYSPDFPTLAIKPPLAVDAYLPQELASLWGGRAEGPAGTYLRRPADGRRRFTRIPPTIGRW